jgi:hypothetical protein
MKLGRWPFALAHKEAAHTGMVELHGATSSELADVLSDLEVCVAPLVTTGPRAPSAVVGLSAFSFRCRAVCSHANVLAFPGNLQQAGEKG